MKMKHRVKQLVLSLTKFPATNEKRDKLTIVKQVQYNYIKTYR